MRGSEEETAGAALARPAPIWWGSAVCWCSCCSGLVFLLRSNFTDERRSRGASRGRFFRLVGPGGALLSVSGFGRLDRGLRRSPRSTGLNRGSGGVAGGLRKSLELQASPGSKGLSIRPNRRVLETLFHQRFAGSSLSTDFSPSFWPYGPLSLTRSYSGRPSMTISWRWSNLSGQHSRTICTANCARRSHISSSSLRQ